MYIKKLIKDGMYNEALDYSASNFDSLNKKELKLLKRILLFCAIDFIHTYKNDKYSNNMNNPFFMINKRLDLIKTIIDVSPDIFYYLYFHINDYKYIENELNTYKEYFKDIVFIKKDEFYLENDLKNDLQTNGIIKIDSFFDKDKIKLINKITKEYLDKSELSEYFYNENRSRIYLRKKNNNIDILGIFKNLIDIEKIENLLKEYINIDVKCNFIQLEHMKKSPVSTDQMHAWHIDNLSDQFKVFIPLVDVNEDNAPMRYLPKSHIITNLNAEMKQYYHYIFRMAGVDTNPTTGLPQYFIDKMKITQEKALIKSGDIALFNTTLMHTGSFVQSSNCRLNLVLVFNNITTNRNLLFKQFKTFY